LQLRLAVSRGELGLELEAPFGLGPLSLTALSLGLPGIKFPVDLSGGVARFRHRRGRLDHLELQARALDISAFAASRLSGLLGPGTPDVVIAPTAFGALIGLRRGEAALAFDLIAAPSGGAIVLLAERARGLSLGAPPHVIALRALALATRGIGRLEGGAVVIEDIASTIVRDVLPGAGARAPSTSESLVSPLESELTTFRLTISRDAPLHRGGARAESALELAEHAREADRAAVEGDVDAARRGYLDLLERMPRHPEVSERLAWIDATAGRNEAALATVADLVPAAYAGAIGGVLLESVGDLAGAAAAYSRAATDETYGVLAALLWARAGACETGPERVHALDEALARAPGLEAPRWARIAARLDRGDATGALADAEHLEAAARGARARAEVWRRAGDALLDRGFLSEARRAFERALRYAPDDIPAMTALGRSLAQAGEHGRALPLFARAVARAEARKGSALTDDHAAASLELAKTLVVFANDRPAAIARARAIPTSAREAFEARALEGTWRAELGDLAGAAAAFGRLVSLVEAARLDGDEAARVAGLLLAAATIEERERGDERAAQHLVALAVRLRPKDRRATAELRRLAGASEAERLDRASRTRDISSVETDPPPAMAEPPVEDETFAHELEPEVDLESAAEQLSNELRAHPNDQALAMRLANVLEQLGRDLDLLALLSARMEEGDEDARAEVEPHRRAVLRRLAKAARDEGRPSEAELYEMMADASND
jgi:tetratricopeptide (TPR) repeat protein